ncbi:glycosyltransferase [Acinetobacter baumannii]|uniref:Gtr88 n=3 Tax=Acinetobacter calcoaceticus/baumannii complex TaxID=909768 RepID=A0A6B9KX32_ACIBA|nr:MULTISPECIES: glycosyltransferase family 2 protein [Acinetobacter calcoaceticus/baumannii complex]SSW75759.1 family 2 glycosyl transferase [Klebsiella pneumoniae]ENV28484.1 hypothetical protein F961_03058 [Acinetobacter baumannii NIPH 60]MCQ1047420.1 glycosyltransferase [Acinetobacter baumannii]MCZ3370024.1 glycosyltransferase [Acinetobacter baumannii]MDC4617296.1 glycosyltransferase [Acinetobacter baumannii]
MSIELTIFTPSYNRAHTLPRVYQSLKEQTLQNFEWLIIDDGSVDDTEKVVSEFINEQKLKIRYIKQENVGKQAAWNKAIAMAEGRIFCCLDSDDALYSKYNVDDIFTKYSSFFERDDVVGLRFLAYSNVKNTYDGDEVSKTIVVRTYFYELSNHKNYGERIDFIKTHVIKNFLFPVEKDIKFIPEIWFYVALAKAGYSFVYIPEPARIFFDDDPNNRLSRSSIRKHAKGHYISRAKILCDTPLEVYMTNPRVWIASLIRFSQCANYLNISFKKRKEDVGLLYAFLSYLLFISIFSFR